MRHRAVKQTLQHETQRRQNRLACWIKDKAGTGNGQAAPANLGWFHSCRIPGVCTQQRSFWLGWKASLAAASPPTYPTPGSSTGWWKCIGSSLMGNATPQSSPKSAQGQPPQGIYREKAWFHRIVEWLEGKGPLRVISSNFAAHPHCKENLMGTSRTTWKWSPGHHSTISTNSRVSGESFAPSHLH